MRILLAQLAPVPGDLHANAERLAAAVRTVRCDLAVFPELFLSGYRVGDRFHQLALKEGDRTVSALRRLAHETGTTLVVGAPVASTERSGEIHNAALAVPPEGEHRVQVKRYLPTFGPFEEGVSSRRPTGASPSASRGHRSGSRYATTRSSPRSHDSSPSAGRSSSS